MRLSGKGLPILNGPFLGNLELFRVVSGLTSLASVALVWDSTLLFWAGGSLAKWRLSWQSFSTGWVGHSCLGEVRGVWSSGCLGYPLELSGQHPAEPV